MHIVRLRPPRLASLVLAAALAVAVSRPADAQHPTPSSPDDRAEVLAVVNRLFDAMRTGDSAAVRSVFHPQAQLATALVREGRPAVRVESVEGFVRAVGTPHDEVWDERLHDQVVHVDGPLAVVWTGYRFYLGDRFSHCGVDAFQLARTEGGWKIVALADTRRTTGCDVGR